MADITMCNATNCKDKELCYRYKAVPDELYQSMFDPSMNEPKTKDNCSEFWKLNSHRKDGKYESRRQVYSKQSN